MAIVRQHHAIAGRPRFSTVYDEELLAVDGALRRLDGGRSEQALIQICARVSELAVRDSRANRHEPATIGYAFGGLDDKPHKFFLERVARLREQDEQAAKELHDSELTAALLGVRPVKVHPHPPRPGRSGLASSKAGRHPGDSNPPLSATELLMNIEQLTERLNSQHVARAG